MALALQDNPELAEHVPAPGGGPGQVRVRKAELQAYLRRNRQRLSRQAQELRASATAEQAAVGMPKSHAEWLTWMEEHEAEFLDAMRKQGPSERRALNQRLTPQVAFPTADQETPTTLFPQHCFRDMEL